MTIHTIIAQFELQTGWFLNALEDISDEESNQQADAQQNPVKWVAGHLTDARMTIFSILSGQEINTHYKSHFGKGTSNVLDATFPTIEQIKADWIAVSSRLKSALQNAPGAQLAAKPPFQTSIPDETLQGLVAYFAMHESFHIGQLSILRKLLNKPPMAMGRR